MPRCTMCSKQTPGHFDIDDNHIQPTGGLHLAILTGYGMFTDPMDEVSSRSLSKVCLCHDCSIRFIDMFPQKFKDKFFTGGHPIEICRTQSHTHPDGCHYAWT